jgi:hypothetical protein
MRHFGFSFSPYVAKVRRCLELKGLTYTYVEVPYLDRRELLALTGGYVHVPVLEDGGTVVTDSARITAWLDEQYAPSLRADPLAVLIEAWAENVLEDVAFRIGCPLIDSELPRLFGGRDDARALWRLFNVLPGAGFPALGGRSGTGAGGLVPAGCRGPLNATPNRCPDKPGVCRGISRRIAGADLVCRPGAARVTPQIALRSAVESRGRPR